MAYFFLSSTYGSCKPYCENIGHVSPHSISGFNVGNHPKAKARIRVVVVEFSKISKKWTPQKSHHNPSMTV